MEIITFALGIIVGFCIFAGLYAFEYVLDRKKSIGKAPIQRLEGQARRLSCILTKQKGAVIMPKTDEEEAREELIARNAADGKETKLEDL